MGIFKFKSIRKQLTFWVLLMALLPLTIFGAIMYRQMVKSSKDMAFDNLTTIRDLKVQQLNAWLTERIIDVSGNAKNDTIRSTLDLLNSDVIIQDSTESIENIRGTLNTIRNNYREYYEVFIINASSGKVEISTDVSQEGNDKLKDSYFTEPMRSGRAYIKSIYYSNTNNKTSMAISAPIFSIARDDQITGILVARIDLRQSLYKLLNERSGLGITGETLIVNEEAFALSDLRWHNHAPLQLQIEAEPAVNSSRGKTGVFEADDYRGKRVLAAYTYIPRTRWGFVAKQDLEEVYAPLQTLLKTIVITLVIIIVVIYVLTVFLAGNLTKPALKMASVSKEIQQGNLSARNDVITSNELGFLALTFNEMADSVEQRTIDLKRSQANLIQAEKLSAIGKLSASIAHEFNNPICGIRNVLESIANKDFETEDEEEKSKLLSMAIRECNRIANLVRNLNDFNRPSTGKIIIINIEDSINEVIFMYKKRLKERNIQLETNYGNKPLMVEGVADQIKQVFLNIIQNAEESFSEKNGGKITISTERRNSKGIICIEDTGCGIEQENISRLFEPFFSTKLSSKGTGLGLPICYGIIQAHKGDIQIRNAQGKGTIFTVILPLQGEV